MAYQVSTGLGEIAYRQNDPRTAIKNYQLYPYQCPHGTDEAKSVAARLKELGPNPRPDRMRVAHVITRLIVGGAQEKHDCLGSRPATKPGWK